MERKLVTLSSSDQDVQGTTKRTNQKGKKMGKLKTDGAWHLFHRCHDGWYDEECMGPMEADTLVDLNTGNLYLVVHGGRCEFEFEGETIVREFDPGVYRLDCVKPIDGTWPPTWEGYMHLGDLPKSCLKVAETQKPGRTRSITEDWQPSW
jgi:hypothetical protein